VEQAFTATLGSGEKGSGWFGLILVVWILFPKVLEAATWWRGLCEAQGKVIASWIK